MPTITVTEASRNFSDLISRVRYAGETAILVKGGKPVARVIPIRSAPTGRELAARWAALPKLAVAEAKSFSADVAKARRDRTLPASKWA